MRKKHCFVSIFAALSATCVLMSIEAGRNMSEVERPSSERPLSVSGQSRHGSSDSAGGDVKHETTASQSLDKQLRELEATLPQADVKNFQFQKEVPRASTEQLRPHHLPFNETLLKFPVPVQPTCPSSQRPDAFCTPNIGRDWKRGASVFPISYSLPEEMFARKIPVKDKDCADIVPRIRSSYRFASEAEYIREYSRSYFCITFKKGGWDVLRHYEIISAGCMPYIIDLEYSPIFTLYHLPKQLLLEARSLPGVRFNCSTVSVSIDHTQFPKAKYFEMLAQLLKHAVQHLTTKAMAKYFLASVEKQNARRVLYLAAANKKAPLRAQGNYNSWTLFHGLRELLGDGAIDPFQISFLYQQPPQVAEAMKKKLYGLGFGYAFRLPIIDVNRTGIIEKIESRYFDLVIYGDPTSMLSSSTKQLKLLTLIQKHYSKNEIVFLHAPDIAYPAPAQQGYDPAQLYDAGIVFQREIMDCQYYAPPASNLDSEMMKRCVWYRNKNCFDDVNIPQFLVDRNAKSYLWSVPTT